MMMMSNGTNVDNRTTTMAMTKMKTSTIVRSLTAIFIYTIAVAIGNAVMPYAHIVSDCIDLDCTNALYYQLILK